jgi:tRNA-dihydrouridine synthase B
MDPLPISEVKDIMLGHVHALHEFYGEFLGPRIARKHVGWYLKEHEQASEFRRTFNALEAGDLQLEALEGYFDNVAP